MDLLVIGAGIVGLAAARAMARRGHSVVVAEAEGAIGTGVSSRSSEVIHGGMYYPPGSLRAHHCTRGRRMLYEFCEIHGVLHARPGKLIVAACEAERGALEGIAERGRINGVEDLVLLEGREAIALEPNLSCLAALSSPITGIVDSHALMLALQGDIQDAGGAIAFHTRIGPIQRIASGWDVEIGGQHLTFDGLVNAAGLGAQTVAAGIADYPAERIPRQVLAKGSYFGCLGRPAFSRLIYPAPVEGGLGIHLTLDLSGRMRFGPDVEWVESADYVVDPLRAERFALAIRRYWPALPAGALTADYAGIRPKLTGPGEPAADFIIDAPADHGLPGLVQLFGIESPGLTASLSLAESVADLLDA